MLMELPPDVPYTPCWAIWDNEKMEVVDLSWVCFFRDPPTEPAQPKLSPRQQALSDLAKEYNQAFCEAIADQDVSGASAYAAKETRSRRLDAFEEWNIGTVELVEEARESRDC